eukprot:tig00001107_g7091.t1
MDAQQLKYMDEEYCILVDDKDNAVGKETKKTCHLNTNLLLHRAFSVFLFNSAGKLLLQQRAREKITFPLVWTNTCCSHPLYVPEEMEMENDRGVKRAAQRKLEHELGIADGSISRDEFTVMTRILYKAPMDETWGEHELDYLLVVQKDVDLKLNRNEVEDVKYVDQAELQALLSDADKGVAKLSPWFRLVVESGMLSTWWGSLKSLEGHQDRNITDFRRK